MGKVFAGIDERNATFINAQHLFFVATAPAGPHGHINLSPKGLDAFRILSPRTVAYADLTGSGIETIAHLRENGRIVIMFCALAGPPRILRLHGHGEVIEPCHDDFDTLRQLFPPLESLRAVIRVRLDRIADSCGFGVPRFRYVADRPQLAAWAENRGAEGLAAYRSEHNRRSIDGLPGLDAGVD